MNNIDEALQRFGGQMYGAGNQTPGANYPSTPMSSYIPAPPMPTPTFSMPTPVGQMAAAQQMAYQQISQNYMSPSVAFTAGAQFSGFASPAQWTMPGMGNFRPLAPPAPPPMAMTPGVTASFTNPYDAGIAGMMQRQSYIYGDPGNARSRYSGVASDEFQASMPGIMTGVAGSLMGGALLGAKMGAAGGSVGGFVGNMVGGVIGGLAGAAVGGIYGFGQSVADYGAIQNMGIGTRLQGGTQGMISMGDGSMGLGGRGMNTMAAAGLGQQLKGLASASGGSANTNDMINLTNAAAESGLLNESTNMDQIFSTVKKLTGMIGQMARLTGDPDFRNNIREIGNMHRMGFSIDQVPGVISNLNMSSRMAGVTRGQLQPSMEMGASIFGSTGMLTTGIGEQYGAFAQGVTRLGAGSMSAAQLNLLGGEQGMQQRMTQVGAATLTGPMQALLPYLVKEDEEGNLVQDKDAIAQFMSGKGNISTMMAKGARSLSQKGRAQIITRQAELTSGIADEMGPWGILQATNALIQQTAAATNESYEVAAATVLGAENGRMISELMQSPEFHTRVKAQAREEERREMAAARERGAGRVAEQKDYDSWGSRFSRWKPMGDLWTDNANTGMWDDRQNRRTTELAIKSMRQEEEAATGSHGVYSVFAGESEQFKTRSEARSKQFDPMGGSGGISNANLVEIFSRRQGDLAFNELRGGGVARKDGHIVLTDKQQDVVSRVKENVAGLGAMKQFADDEAGWEIHKRGMKKKLSASQTQSVERIAVDYAKEMNDAGQPLDLRGLKDKVIAFFGNGFYEANKETIDELMAGALASNSDPNVRRKYFEAVDPMGLLGGGDVDVAQASLVKAKSEWGKILNKEGIIPGDEIGPEAERGLMTLAADDTIAAAMLAIASGDTNLKGQFSDEEIKKAGQALKDNPGARKMYEAIANKAGLGGGNVSKSQLVAMLGQAGTSGTGALGDILGKGTEIGGRTKAVASLRSGDPAFASSETADPSKSAAAALAFEKLMPKEKAKLVAQKLMTGASALEMAAKIMQAAGDGSSMPAVDGAVPAAAPKKLNFGLFGSGNVENATPKP